MDNNSGNPRIRVFWIQKYKISDFLNCKIKQSHRLEMAISWKYMQMYFDRAMMCKIVSRTLLPKLP